MFQNALTLTLCIVCLSTLAQAQHRLSGRIIDERNQPVAYANILILQPADSSLLKGAITAEDGRFTIPDVEAGDYLLRVSMVGFREYYQTLNLSQNNELPAITLTEEAITLAAAEVVAKKPFLEQQAGMMVVNVANSIIGANGNVIDILRKVPGLIIVNNQIRLAGQSGMTILIDGRPTQYLDMQSLLRDMPAANIEKIEVISQPGARFDAQGSGAVINIVLKRNLKLGLNGTATAGGGYGRYWKYRGSGTVNYRTGKVNLSNSVAFSHRSGFENLRLNRIIGEEVYSQVNEQPNLPYSLNIKSGVDYFINDKHKAGVNLNLLGSINQSTDRNLTTISSPNPNNAADLLTTNKIDRRWGYANVDAYYEFQIDTSGQRLSLDGSVNRYGRHVDNLLQTQVLSGDFTYPDRRQEQPGNTNIQAYRLDYTKPFGKTARIETGLKYSYAEVDNDLMATFQTTNGWQTDPSLTNHFIFTEKIAAAYLNGNFTLGKLEINSGLRYEDSQSAGYSVTLDSTQERRISRLFPSINLATPLAGKLGLALAYSNRINRPSYNSLNPFAYFLDPYTYRRGNPFLRPEISDSYKFSLTFDKQPFFNLEYIRTNDVIQLVIEQDDASGVAFGIDKNLSTYDRLGGSLFFPLDWIKNVSGYGGFMLYYNRYRSLVLQEAYDDGAWNFTTFLQVTYSLPADWKLEFNGWYSGPGVEGITRTRGLYGTSLGLQKKLWNDRGSLQISWEDFAYQYWRAQVNHSNLAADFTSEWEVGILNVSLSYNFGNQFLKKAERRRSVAQDEQSRTREK